jgi:hypothetical protein
MPIFGIIASSNMSTKLTDFYQIATTTVGSGGAANVTFSSIPQDYTHLQIRYITRTVSANAEDQYYINYNGVTSSNYRSHQVYGTGASAVSSDFGTSTVGSLGIIPGGTTTAGIFSVGFVDILDYTNTNKYKTYRNLTGFDKNGSGQINLTSGVLLSTLDAITSVAFRSNSNLAEYSSFALYGVKA